MTGQPRPVAASILLPMYGELAMKCRASFSTLRHKRYLGSQIRLRLSARMRGGQSRMVTTSGMPLFSPAAAYS